MSQNLQIIDSLSPHLLEQFVTLLETKSGIVFDELKKKELQPELDFRLQQLKINSYNLYFEFLKKDEKELKELINQITINETFFFRIPEHFQELKRIFDSDFVNRKNDCRINVWSCGCSSGEEAYSILIILKEIERLKDFHIHILATDINEEMLYIAKKGIYSGRTLNTVPAYYLEKYFEPCLNRFRIKEELKKSVSFKYLNLAADFKSEISQKFDLIFFRNVMIYFSRQLTKKIINSFYDLLEDPGYLFLGPSETLFEINDSFQLILKTNCFFYQKSSATVKKEEQSPPAENSFNLEVKKFISTADIQQLKLTEIKKREPPPVDFAFRKDKVRILLEELELLFDLGEYRKAEEKFSQLDFIAPDNQEVALLRLIFSANQNQKDFRTLADYYLERWPLFAEIYFLIAKHCQENKKYDEAEEYFKKVVFLNQNYLIARWNLLQLYLRFF